MTAITRDPLQRQHALELANKVRLARCELRRQIGAGAITAAEVITDPPDCALTMTVRDVLMAQHRWGRHRALRLLVVAQVREGKTLGSLTAPAAAGVGGSVGVGDGSEGVDRMTVIERCDVELCADCEAGRSPRPLIECQHIGPDDAGAVVEFIRADAYRVAVERIRALHDNVKPLRALDDREQAYAHGYSVALSDALEVLVRGQS